MTNIEKVLNIVSRCIEQNTYEELETERLEFKDLSTNGSWNELYKTVCAFLNTNGGIIVIGIKEKGNEKDKAKKHYRFTGFNYDHEPKLKEVAQQFTNASGIKLNLSNYFPTPEIRDFQEGKVAILYVSELPDDEKYIYFDKKAYQRRLTGDHELSQIEIETYEELKSEVITKQELSIVKEADLDILNIDTLNQYILRHNKGKKKGETLKANVETALSFLNRESFIREDKPTLLGMLICGDHVENYIQGKCEVDCYVTSPIKVAQSKEVINDNIIALIEGSFNFIWRNIQVGVGYAKGGIAEPEYPEELIRECINNAIAHRNYSTDRFVIIEIRPQTNLTIRNPGNFQRRQRINLDTPSGKIRRIIPIQVARNPKLTHILKSFDYWEGKGRGLSSLTDACLDNQIDVPYYVLSDGEIKLVIPTGKVWDSEMEIWFQSFAGFLQQKIGRNLADDEKIMLSFFRKSELLNRLENYTILLTNDNNHKDVIMQLEEKGLIFKDSESPEFYPIYKVHRSLMKDDFSDDLKNCLGIIWDELKDEYKDILNSIYFYNVYGGKNESISANLIGNAIYMKQYKVIQDGNNYENFKRKVRNIFNQLENKRLIVRKDGKSKDENGKPDFKINEQYKNELELFNL